LPLGFPGTGEINQGSICHAICPSIIILEHATRHTGLHLAFC